MGLSGQQRKELQEALMDAFPDEASLEQMLSLELDKNLYIIASGANLSQIVFKLIKKAETENWVEDLVSAARRANPGNQSLKDIAKSLGYASVVKKITAHDLSQQQTAGLMQQQKILILAAIPHGLRLDKEIREIENAIRRATRQDLFEICIRTAVRPQDIRRAMAEEKPQVVHFCGHGLEDGSLLLEDDGENNKPVVPQGLATLFKQHSNYVKCVLFNACHSVKTADVISEHIDYAIGMNQEIGDKVAILFAQGFYDGLGYESEDNQDVFEKAFDEGLVAIALEDFPQKSIPVLKKKL